MEMHFAGRRGPLLVIEWNKTLRCRLECSIDRQHTHTFLEAQFDCANCEAYPRGTVSYLFPHCVQIFTLDFFAPGGKGGEESIVCILLTNLSLIFRSSQPCDISGERRRKHRAVHCRQPGQSWSK